MYRARRLAHRGASPETCLRRSEVRSPRAGLVNLHSGGFRDPGRAALRPLCREPAGRGPPWPSSGPRATTVRNGTGATANGRKRRTSEARPGAEARFRSREMPRWSAERRAGQRHWPVISGEPEIGPTARRATGCGASAPSACRRSTSPRRARRGEQPGQARTLRAARTKEAV
jgi:hypothetical protein